MISIWPLGTWSGGQPGNVSVLLNKGNGAFMAQKRVAAGFDPRDVALGDWTAMAISTWRRRMPM